MERACRRYLLSLGQGLRAFLVGIQGKQRSDPLRVPPRGTTGWRLAILVRACDDVPIVIHVCMVCAQMLPLLRPLLQSNLPDPFASPFHMAPWILRAIHKRVHTHVWNLVILKRLLPRSPPISCFCTICVCKNRLACAESGVWTSGLAAVKAGWLSANCAQVTPHRCSFACVNDAACVRGVKDA